MKTPVSHFFMGKGGVGKSTTSAIYSVSLAKMGYRVVLVSMDPAHNLSDIFEKKLSDKPGKISSGLSVIELDQEKWVKNYLTSISQQIKRTYSYLTAFNLESYFDVIRFSPGLEEYALILAFQSIQQDFQTHDFLVFDMPPTALSLKFFNLPSLSLVWTQKLLELRQEIIKKRELITKIKLIKKEYETDKVLNKIMEQNDYFTSLKSRFEDQSITKIKLVLNPDELSFAESNRIIKWLEAIHIQIDHVFFNKAQETSSASNVETLFSGIPNKQIPYSNTPLIGYKNLEQFLKNSGISFHVPSSNGE